MHKKIINSIDCSVPVTKFAIRASVTVNEELPKVTEFALRLLKVCGSMPVLQLANFFGLSSKESRILIEALVDESLVRFENDELQLTAYAESKFHFDDEMPRFTVVKEQLDEVSFDLITLEPILVRNHTTADNFAIELQSRGDVVTDVISLVERSYQRHFNSIMQLRGDEIRATSIYKISDIRTKKHLSKRVVVDYTLSENFEVDREILFDDIDSDNYRSVIEEAVSNSVPKGTPFRDSIIGLIAEGFGDKVIGAFLRNGKFSFREYLYNLDAGLVTYDDNTEPIVGNLYSPHNLEALVNRITSLALSGSPSAGDDAEPCVAWLAPSNHFWGRSLSFVEAVRDISVALRGGNRQARNTKNVRFVYPSGSELKKQIFERYRVDKNRYLDEFHLTDTDWLDSKVELFLYPGKIGAVLIHFDRTDATGCPLPFGFVTENNEKLKKIEALFLNATNRGKDFVHGTKSVKQDSTISFEKVFDFLPLIRESIPTNDKHI